MMYSAINKKANEKKSYLKTNEGGKEKFGICEIIFNVIVKNFG